MFKQVQEVNKRGNKSHFPTVCFHCDTECYTDLDVNL